MENIVRKPAYLIAINKFENMCHKHERTVINYANL